MTAWPLRFQPIPGSDKLLFVSDAGDFFRADEGFLSRLAEASLSSHDSEFLRTQGLTFGHPDDLDYTGFVARWARRLHVPAKLSYIILVPTLRCNLDCSYCQVSRVSQRATGFDWSEDRVQQVLRWLDGLETDRVKIEFQGGEPLLRLDLLERVRSFCRARFAMSRFVVCTNLQDVSGAAWEFLSDPDTFISTSFDGTAATHTRQRTKTPEVTEKLLANIRFAMAKFGPDKISALPTIDVENPPEPTEIVADFAALGFNSVFLRRVNHQGFARKRHAARESTGAWLAYHRRFIDAVIQHNASHEHQIEEYYLAHILRRIMQGGHNGHTDLRNPAWIARDFLLIDFDGTFYPTDEARMLTRVGVADLSIGSLSAGLDHVAISAFDSVSTNSTDPDCIHCAYQPFCGTDPIDDISRYGRVDLPRHLTEHCRLHKGLFDFAFELLYSSRSEVRSSVAAWLRAKNLPTALTPDLEPVL